MSINNNFQVNAVKAIELNAGDGNVVLSGTNIELKSHLTFSTVTQEDIQGDLGLLPGTNVQPYSSVLDDLVVNVTNTYMPVSNGSTYVSTAPADVRTNLGLVIGTDVQPQSARLNDLATADVTAGNMLIADGDTYVASNATQVKTNLGLTVGSDVQAYSANLASVAGLGNNENYVVAGDGSAGFKLLSTVDLLADISAQEASAVLTDISALGEPISQDLLMYSTSANTFDYTSISEFGRSLVSQTTSENAVICLQLEDGTKNLVLSSGQANFLMVSDNSVIGYNVFKSHVYSSSNDTPVAIVAEVINEQELAEFEFVVSAKRVSALNGSVDGLCYKYKCLVRRNAGGNVEILSSINAENLFKSAGVTASCDIQADVPSQSINVVITGESSTAMVWNCSYSRHNIC